MPRVLIACDKFKGSAGSAEIADALARGLPAEWTADPVPVADGGDGTVDAALAAGFRELRGEVTGPYGESVTARYALEESTGRAVLEVAETSGLRLVTDSRGNLPEGIDAAAATSAGLGQLVLQALDHGAREIVIGLGGSATNDAGAGMAAALGARILEADGSPLTDWRRLGSAARVDLSGLDPRLGRTRFIAASDVTSPLTGPEGAMAVFGPQKGLAPEQVPERDAALDQWARVLEAAAGTQGVASRPGAGAAGGLGFACLALLGADYASGAELVLDLGGFDALLESANLVVTGEGRLDAQTLSGKAPAVVASRARARGVPVVAVCGQNALPQPEGSATDDSSTDDAAHGAADDAPESPFQDVLALTDVEPDVQACISNPLPVLKQLGGRLAEQARARGLVG